MQNYYGVDWEGPISNSEDVECVEVPPMSLDLSPQQLVELHRSVDPLEQCDDLGVSLYVTARTFIRACF